MALRIPARVIAASVLVFATAVCCLAQEQRPSEETVLAAIRRAVGFFHGQVSIQGGYVWRYSADLRLREGEGKVGDSTAWVQPPGTPTVGLAYLDGYLLTREPVLLEAALGAAGALLRGQLRSGGWTYRIEFDPEARRRYAYRVDPERGRAFNVTTLDDDTTQAAVRFLMRLDKALGFRNERSHEATRYALDCLVRAQYPNGAWPQGYDAFPDPKEFPPKRASYPDEWERTWPGDRRYWRYYTLNDNVLVNTVRLMLRAWETYRDERYRRAALKGGEFAILAQMPDPQPAWAQQYDFDMHPTWARKFEPPAITGGESQGVIFLLLELYDKTGEEKFLAPVRPAIEYLKRSRLPDGSLARFYELRTNRPLFFNRRYELTYDDSDLPTHYAFKVPFRLAAAEEAYERLRERGPSRLPYSDVTVPRLTETLVRQCRRVLGALDDRGAWVERGALRYHKGPVGTGEIIDSKRFAENLLVLCRYLAALRNSRQ